MKKKIIISLLSIIFVVLLFYLSARYIGPNGLKVKEYKIKANISENFHGFKIVHFSDLYYKSTINKSDLTNIVNKINFIKPDVVVFTGDLINKNIEITEEIKKELIENLSKIDTVIGKYAVTGENDDIEFRNIMEASKFIILNNSYDLIYKNTNSPILIAGIDYETNIEEKLTSIYEYINNNPIQYKILLMHEPDNIDKINNFDLVLTGHSLKNQINIPIIKEFFKINGAKKYYNDYYNVNGMNLYINSGLGILKYKLRLFNKPSINFYRITKES